MCLAKYDDVVEALTPDRTDHSLNIAILPRLARRVWSVPDPHRPKPLHDDGAVGAIPNADELSRRRVPGECLGDLACDPLRCRIRSHVGPDQP